MMNIELLIRESVMSGVMSATEEVVMKVVMWCSSEYNFSGEEALRRLNISVNSKCDVKCDVKLKSKCDVKLSSKLEDKCDVKLKSKSKPRFALPYNGELDELCCQGLSKNQGLYTQCLITRMDSSAFCKSCKTSAECNNGVPEYGTIVERHKAYTEGIEFKDPSGKSPIPYAKIMKKQNVTQEEVLEEASKLNMIINPIHFEADPVKKSGRPALKKKEEVEVKAKGRPKKAKKVLELAGEEEDLFASLVMSANKNEKEVDIGSEDEVNEDADTVIMSDSEDEEDAKLDIAEDKEILAEELSSLIVVEEAANLAAEEAAKLAAEEASKLAEEEASKLAAEEASKLASKLAEEERKKKAADAKKEEERLEKESKKKAADEEKELKKKAAEAKKEEERLEKEAKKKAAEEEKSKKETKKSKKDENKSSAAEEKKVDAAEEKKVDAVVEEEEQDVVKRFEFEGKKYLKSKKSGIIYNMDQDVIGKWNEAKQRIDFYTNDEESCDEYEE
jgi:hypothetical protein